MIGDRGQKPWYHSDFYRHCYRKTLIWLIVSILIMLCLIAANIYVVIAQPNTKYYASTTTGQVIPMLVRR